MTKHIRVLKSNQVKVSGSVRLTPESVVAPVRTAFSAPADTPQTNATPQSARIIESNNECAVIEVICSCGNKNHVKCNYSDVAKSEK